MSASRIPVRRPMFENATARLAVSEDLPTPPLPEATAITRQSRGRRTTLSRSGAPPRSFVVNACRSSGVITEKESEKPRTPGTAVSAWSTCFSKESRNGQPAIVRTIVSETTPSSTSMSRTMSSSVTGRCSSGSMTCSSAARIASRLGSTLPRVTERSYGGRDGSRTAEMRDRRVRRVLERRLARQDEDVDGRASAAAPSGLGAAGPEADVAVPARLLGPQPAVLTREPLRGGAERPGILEHGGEQVAVRQDALERHGHREVARADIRGQLLPAERCRYGSARFRPHRVHRGDRLSPPVLTVVHEDARALLLQPLRRHEPLMPLLQQS